jgi:ssDNA-binding Zn-finger/Zn-ribbon topoisomerase 1
MTMSLKQQYENYIARLRARGDEITNYECPDCGGVIDTKAAPEGESWDTLSTCPHCEALHMKSTNGSSAHGEALPA